MEASSKQGQLILGVDLGGSKIGTIVADAGANIIARDDRDTCAARSLGEPFNSRDDPRYNPSAHPRISLAAGFAEFVLHIHYHQDGIFSIDL